MKTIEKTSKGITFIFKQEKGRGYKVYAKGFCTYWYQSTLSVREAKKRFINP